MSVAGGDQARVSQVFVVFEHECLSGGVEPEIPGLVGQEGDGDEHANDDYHGIAQHHSFKEELYG